MTSFFYVLNTGTLAAWLSVAGFGAVGIIVPEWRWSPVPKPQEEQVTEVFDPEIVLGESDAVDSAPAAPEPAEVVETLPSPPQLPELAEPSPLPEIPDLPAPAAEKPVAKTTTHTESSPPARKATTSAPRSAQSGVIGGAAAGAAKGLSDTARLAAGRMPAPNYPSVSRQAGQTGTVTVAFTVDSSGKVISAHAVNPSPWPLLNEEAVRTVRRWKFPPGGVMKIQRPIIFQLR